MENQKNITEDIDNKKIPDTEDQKTKDKIAAENVATNTRSNTASEPGLNQEKSEKNDLEPGTKPVGDE